MYNIFQINSIKLKLWVHEILMVSTLFEVDTFLISNRLSNYIEYISCSIKNLVELSSELNQFI